MIPARRSDGDGDNNDGSNGLIIPDLEFDDDFDDDDEQGDDRGDNTAVVVEGEELAAEDDDDVGIRLVA
ncbi:hypothetical protein JCM11491_000558 [Sporobolomyces phaffii]